MAVYFIRCGSDGPVKIGCACSPEQRLRDLQVGNPEELVLLRAIDGEKRHERWLHDTFKPYLIRGEWYRFIDEMLSIVVPEIPVTPVVKREGRIIRDIPYNALREWITQTPDQNQSEVARQLGMTRAAVSKMILGHAKPSLEIAVAIERLTDGKVPPSSWVTAA